MAKKVEDILKLVEHLTPEEREMLVATLNSITGTNYIGMLNLKVQKFYKCSITKRSAVFKNVVTIYLQTPYGKYQGTGDNKREAGEKAAFEALKEFPADVENA